MRWTSTDALRGAVVATTVLATALSADTAALTTPAHPGSAFAHTGATGTESTPDRRVEGAAGPPDDSAPGLRATGGDPSASLAAAVAHLDEAPVRLSVSVLGMERELRATYGTETFDTASIVKVNVLAALLLDTQDSGRELTGRERTLAQAMIQHSDNEATTVLWSTIGGAAGLDAANRRLGLTATRGGADGHWGLTQTTSRDQLALLRAIFDNGSALGPPARAYLSKLMTSVAAGQRWGISAAADGRFALKNGWLPRSTTGLWDVNSIGQVTTGGHRYLVAVVSAGHHSKRDGIATVESAARAAVAVVSGEASHPWRPAVP